MRPTTPQTEALLTEAEVIALLGLNHLNWPARVLSRLTKAGKLPAIHITGRIRRYRQSDVDQLITSATSGEPETRRPK